MPSMLMKATFAAADLLLLGISCFASEDVAAFLKENPRFAWIVMLAPVVGSALYCYSAWRVYKRWQKIAANGVHQDGLAHISELSSRYFKDPNDAVKGGQSVKVNMLSADSATKRISHSLKALMNARGTRPPESRVEFSVEVAEGVDDSAADGWRTSWPRSRHAGEYDRERHTNLRSYRILDLEQGRVAQKSPGSFPGLLTQNSIK